MVGVVLPLQAGQVEEATDNFISVGTMVQERTSLLALPDEILDEVMYSLYTDGGSYGRLLMPPSLTCRRLRKATIPILFKYLRIRLTNRYVDKRSLNVVINLHLSPNVASHVRHLRQHDAFCFREDGCEDLNLENELVRNLTIQGLSCLPNVKTISVGCLNSPILKLMPEIFPARAFLIKVEVCLCSSGKRNEYSSLLQELCNSATHHQFAVCTGLSYTHSPLWPLCMHSPTKTTALSWNEARSHDLSFSKVQFPPLSSFTSLEELQIRGPDTIDKSYNTFAEALVAIPQLRRLSLKGAALCSVTLTVVNQLTNLESLRLNSTLDRIFHAHLRNHEFEGLLYLTLPKLKELEIRYISRYLAIEHIVPRTIEHLRIQHHRNERLTTQDINYIARNAPDVRCLEMNIGALANLWHPTAVAGLDVVDMDVYRVFDALSSFRNLRILRLFPSYWQSTGGYLNFSQPVADEQAVRIFNHLRLKCTQLDLLIISNSSQDYSTRNEVFSRGSTSEPMKWSVRRIGQKTLLTTHEAKRTYRLEQIWEGERRLTMTTMRQYGRRQHFDELEDWTLPTYEFPFDEPQACHSETMHSGLRGQA